jgi:hypothetical protein
MIGTSYVTEISHRVPRLSGRSGAQEVHEGALAKCGGGGGLYRPFGPSQDLASALIRRR